MRFFHTECKYTKNISKQTVSAHIKRNNILYITIYVTHRKTESMKRSMAE